MENEKIIPQAQTSKSVSDFIKNNFKLFKTHVSNEFFVNAMKDIGIKSRVSFHQILNNKRNFPKNKIPALSDALDLSFSEKSALHALSEGYQPAPPSFSLQYAVGSASILSHPIHTLVLNLCGLNKKMNSQDLIQSMSSIFPESMTLASIELLLKEGLIAQDESFALIKTEKKFQLSAPSGIKLDHAKNYLQESFDLMKRNYDLPLDQREYAAFTAKIKKEDFSKLKDIVRDFRKSIYELSNPQEQDAVVQVAVGSFIMNSEENKKT